MEGARLLQITSNDLFYGGSHKGTFTVFEKDVKVLLNLFRKIVEDLNKLDYDNDNLIYEVESMMEHLHEYLEVGEEVDDE